MNKICLAGCAILKGRKILLLHRVKDDWYELPGGKIEKTENPEDAVIRELKEELLVDIEILKSLGEKDFEENGFVMGYIWFLAKIKQEMISQVGEKEKFDHFKYIDLSRLSSYKLSPNMMNFNNYVVGSGRLNKGKLQA